MARAFELATSRGNELWAQNKLVEARAAYLNAIELAEPRDDVLTLALKIEKIETIRSTREWLGDQPPVNFATALLGSIALDFHQTPYLHNTYFGKEAYETFHTANYLDELIRTRRFPEIVQPSFLLLYLAMLATKARSVEFLEIGSSLYSAFEKIENCKAFIGAHEAPEIRHIAVELSNRLRWLARGLHEAAPITHIARYQDVPEPAAPRFVFSLGVGNYAFKSTPELAAWVTQSTAAVIRERFTRGQDFVHDVIGKRITCFDIDELGAILSQSGFKISVLSCAEAPAFIDTANPSVIFFNAYLFVHRLSDVELGTLCDLIKTSGAGDIPPAYDTDPIVHLSAEAINSPPGIETVLSGIEWKRQYVRKDSAEGRRRFDFSRTALPERLKGHLADLDMAYGSDLVARNRSFPDRIRPRVRRAAEIVSVIKLALSGDAKAVATIKRRLRF